MATTNETKWTPGPWQLETESRSVDGSELVITDAIGAYTVATCRILDTGVADVYEGEANARLIAAAPDLAAAARKAIGFIASRLPAVDAEAQGVRETLVAALAKAEGR